MGLVWPVRTRPVQNALHEDEVEPAAEFAPDLGHARDLGKTHLRMQPDRSMIAAVDAGDQDMLAERAGSCNQLADDDAAKAAPAMTGSARTMLTDCAPTRCCSMGMAPIP